jgi:hypothetical protein
MVAQTDFEVPRRMACDSTNKTAGPGVALSAATVRTYSIHVCSLMFSFAAKKSVDYTRISDMEAKSCEVGFSETGSSQKSQGPIISFSGVSSSHLTGTGFPVYMLQISWVGRSLLLQVVRMPRATLAARPVFNPRKAFGPQKEKGAVLYGKTTCV